MDLDSSPEDREFRCFRSMGTAANRVGGEHKGWTITKLPLSHERPVIADAPRSKRPPARLETIAAEQSRSPVMAAAIEADGADQPARARAVSAAKVQIAGAGCLFGDADHHLRRFAGLRGN